jgi:tetratricopeptide (TPR) repeat protein
MKRWMSAGLALMLAGSCAHRSGASAPRLQAASSAVLANPTDGQAWRDLAEAQLAQGDLRSASQSYERATRYGVTDDGLAKKLGARPGLGPGPVTDIHMMALANPTDDELWGDLGDYYLERGDSETALQHYLYAFALDPGDSEWSGHVADLGGIDMVVERIDELSAGAVDDEALGDLGDMMRDNGYGEQACDLYRRALARDRDDSEWTRKVGRCDSGGLGEDTAVDTGGGGMVGMLSALTGGWGGSSDSGSSSAEVDGWLALARSYALEGRTDDALEQLDLAIEADPGNWEASVTRAILTGRSPLEVQSEAAEGADDDEVWGDLGDAFTAAGRFDEALKAYREALERDPSDTEWRHKIEVIAPLLKR